MDLASLAVSDWVTVALSAKIPFCGLRVASLRSQRWPTPLLCLLGSVAVASRRLWIYRVAMFCFGRMILAFRLWRNELPTC